VFTVRYALSPYIKQIRFVFKGLSSVWQYAYSWVFSALLASRQNTVFLIFPPYRCLWLSGLICTNLMTLLIVVERVQIRNLTVTQLPLSASYFLILRAKHYPYYPAVRYCQSMSSSSHTPISRLASSRKAGASTRFRTKNSRQSCSPEMSSVCVCVCVCDYRHWHSGYNAGIKSFDEGLLFHARVQISVRILSWLKRGNCVYFTTRLLLTSF
jgi:hypothetical protein